MRRAAPLVTIAALFVATIAIPAGAIDRGAAPTGERILILGDTPATFEAGTPFHVFHGWGYDPDDGIRWSQLRFRLEVDGVRQDLDGFTVEPFSGSDPAETEQVRWLYNLETGLPAGDHTLSGYWYAPCWWAVDNGWSTEDCGPGGRSARPVVAYELHKTITFVAAP